MQQEQRMRSKTKVTFQKEAEPGFSFVLNSEQVSTRSKMGLIYTKMSMTTYATCALVQFTEEEEDGENHGLAHFRCVNNAGSFRHFKTLVR